MKLVRLFLTAAGLALALAAWQPAAAEIRVMYDAAGKDLFSIAVPDNWAVTTGVSDEGEQRPRVLGLTPEGDLSLWIGFFSPVEAQSVEDAENYVKGLGPRIVQDATVERQKDGTLGDLPARLYSGKGTRDGAPVDFSVGIVSLPGGRQVIGIFVGEYGAREVYKADIDIIAKSLLVGKDGR